MEFWKFDCEMELMDHASCDYCHSWVGGSIAQCDGYPYRSRCKYGQVWTTMDDTVQIDGYFYTVNCLFECNDG